MERADRADSANEPARHHTADRRERYAKLLHSRDRANEPINLEESLHTTARLARLLWAYMAGVVDNPDQQDMDERDFEALYELAGLLADHASAALYAYKIEGAADA